MITSEWIIVLIILLYEIVFVKTKRSSRLRRSFRNILESFFMFIDVNLLFTFIIIKNREKSFHYNEIFRFLNVTSKFKVKIVIYNIKLIFNENSFCIFNWFQDLLNMFLRLSSRNCVSHNITFMKNNIDNYRNKLFEFINQ